MVLLFPALALGETMDDLVKRDGLYYKKFTVVPFTGNITGRTQGTIRDGKEEGSWVGYYINGQLWTKKTYKDGKLEGPYLEYSKNGQLLAKGDNSDGRENGPWVFYHHNGTVWDLYTGTYKNGVKVD